MLISILTLIISVGSLVIALFALRKDYAKFNRETFNQSIFSNENHIMEIESRLAMHPEFLRFHGIEDPDKFLEQHGLTSHEFAYLVNSFTAGSIYYNTASKDKRELILKPGSYRWTMCKSESMKKAWPAIKILLASGDYCDKLEEIIYGQQNTLC